MCAVTLSWQIEVVNLLASEELVGVFVNFVKRHASCKSLLPVFMLAKLS